MAKKNSHPERRTKNGALAARAGTHTTASEDILEIIEQVGSGLENESVTLDAIVSETNELASSLKETATQAGSVADSSAETVSSTNEIAASVEQVTSNLTQMAASATQTTASVKQLSTSIL